MNYSEEHLRKFKKSASFRFGFTHDGRFIENKKSAWKRAKQIRKWYSKLIKQIKK
jgi:hypothetical protein